jgi:DinB superfamily
MDTVLIKKAYQNSAKRIVAICEGITQTEATFRPYDKTNPLIWEVGHLMFFRNTICKILNPTEKLESLPNEKEMFGYGSTTFEADQYPPLEDLLAQLLKRGERMYELLDAVTEEHLATESPVKAANLGVTVGQQVFSFMIHEANHYGEMNILKTLIHRLR